MKDSIVMLVNVPIMTSQLQVHEGTSNNEVFDRKCRYMFMSMSLLLVFTCLLEYEMINEMIM